MITSGGADLDAAHRQHAIAGARVGEALGPGSGEDGDGGDGGDGDGGAEPHHEGRDHAGPEQPLRQRKDQHQDGARARPQADRDDGGEPPLPSAGSGELLGLGRVRVAPGRGMVIVIMVP